MFGGNATERQRRRDRISGALVLFAFAALAIWLMSTDDRTETPHLVVFWIFFILAVPLGGTIVWKQADKGPGDPSVLRHLWLAFLAGGLHTVLDHLRFLVGFIFGTAAGAFTGAALVALVLVFTKRPGITDTTTEPPGHSPGS